LNPDGEAYAIQVAVCDIGVMEIFQSFNGIHELKGIQQ